jgi:hypothetical protein
MDSKPYFLNELRQARAAVLRDAEAIDALIHVFERMGMFLRQRMGTLADCEGVLGSIAGLSPLAKKLPREFHAPFGKLYKSMREARNSAMHEGAYARHLASHAVKLALILEDALSNGSVKDGSGKSRKLTFPNLAPEVALMKIGELMVPNAICAEIWQPLSFIRQSMLESSFSYLPVRTMRDGDSTWKLVSDLELARYLRTAEDAEDRKRRLVQPLADSQKPDGIQLRQPKTYGPEELISAIFKQGEGNIVWDGLPILVVRSNPAKDLLGILTPFDLLEPSEKLDARPESIPSCSGRTQLALTSSDGFSKLQHGMNRTL